MRGLRRAEHILAEEDGRRGPELVYYGPHGDWRELIHPRLEGYLSPISFAFCCSHSWRRGRALDLVCMSD